MWKNVKDILRDGATFPLEEISDANHQIDIAFMLECGNHKSAHEHHETMKTLIEEDVIHDFSLPLTVECTMKIPQALAAPLGIIEQESIDELGQIMKKDHMTHSQTFPGPSGLSVNK